MKAPITINMISIIKAIGAMKRIRKYNRIKNICLFRSKTMDRHCNITGEKCFFKSCQRFALIMLIIIAFSCRSTAQQLIYETGSFVAHIVYVKERVYDVQVIRSPFNRIVARPQIGIAYRAPMNVKYYYQLGIFTGKDCLYSPLLGATVEAGRSWSHLNAGLIIGGYFRNGSIWSDHYYNGYSFIPIVGINLSIKKEFRRIGIELSNKITPIMTIHNISITYRFNTQLKQRSMQGEIPDFRIFQIVPVHGRDVNPVRCRAAAQNQKYENTISLFTSYRYPVYFRIRTSQPARVQYQ